LSRSAAISLEYIKSCLAYLLEGGVGELQHVDDTDKPSIRLDNRQIEVMTICDSAMFHTANSLCIFFKASCTTIVGGAVSGCGVITRTTLHLEASSPAAMTRSTMSLLVKIPAILGIDPSLMPETLLPGASMTHTAVVRRSFISFAASRTLVRGETVGGELRVSMMEVRSG